MGKVKVNKNSETEVKKEQTSEELAQKYSKLYDDFDKFTSKKRKIDSVSESPERHKSPTISKSPSNNCKRSPSTSKSPSKSSKFTTKSPSTSKSSKTTKKPKLKNL